MVDVGVITPVKDEAENLEALFESTVSQSIRPAEWVIVDDDSTDGSTEMIEAFSDEYSWVSHLRRSDSETYDLGYNYAEVLAAGYERLDDLGGDRFDYYMVLDGDMQITDQYVAEIARFLDSHERVVVASGGIYVRDGDELELEERMKHQPAGGATLYDGDFYRGIGGPPRTPCVDSVTKAKARIAGYECRYLDDIDQKAIQARETGHKAGSLTNAKNLGTYNYVLGFHPLMALAKGAAMSYSSRVSEGPAYVGGYLSAWLRDEQKIDDARLRRYYRREQPRQALRAVVGKLVDLG